MAIGSQFLLISSAQETAMFDIHDVLGAPPRTLEIYDIGAMLEGTPRYAPFLASPAAVHVTAFEPQAAERQRLEDQGGPLTCRGEILGDGKHATLHIARYPGCTSLFQPDPDVVNAFVGIHATAPGGNFTTIATERVATTRLDDLDLPPPDYIKLDIQGAELAALANGRRYLSNALVVEAEAMFVALYKAAPLCSDLHCFMDKEGFILHRYMNVAGRNWQPFMTDSPMTPTSQPLWADTVFVRDPTRLRLWSDDDLLVGARLLHALFGSYDLALRLLAAHDARRDSTYAAAYLDALRKEPLVPTQFFSAAPLPT